MNYKYKIDPENYCREKLLLYIPWKENELNILQNFTNYIEAYNFHQQEIKDKMKIYEPAAQIIEHAFIEYESDPNKFIQNDRDIEENNDTIPREIQTDENIYKILNPQENNNFYDIGSDLQIHNYNYINSVETKKKIVNNTKYIQLINSLNEKQYVFFSYIMREGLQNTKQILTCLHGGAGNRKISRIICYISRFIQTFQQRTRSKSRQYNYLTNCTNRKSSIQYRKKTTIHSAFHIPANQPLSTYNKLSWDTLNTLRAKYINLKWIICDKISMVSNNMLRYINFRLKKSNQTAHYLEELT